MKYFERMLPFGLVLLALFAANAYAESPREQLQQMVEQLQKNPSDDALREKIIKLAQELKPATKVPEEALQHEGRGKFAFGHAKSPADYLDAAKEYEQAVMIAPWVPGYYSDLCTIYEKAEKYLDAKRNCEFYLMGPVDTAQLDEARVRIAGLEYGIEKNSAEAIETRKKEEFATFLQSLEGANFSGNNSINQPMRAKVENGIVLISWEIINNDGRGYWFDLNPHGTRITDFRLEFPNEGSCVNPNLIAKPYIVNFSKDGQSLQLGGGGCSDKVTILRRS